MNQWEERIGGQIGVEFRKALEDPSGVELARFTLKHPFETKLLLHSYEQTFHKPFEELLNAFYNQELLENSQDAAFKQPTKKFHKKPSIPWYGVIAYFLFVGMIPATCYILKSTIIYRNTQASTASLKPQVAGISTSNLAVLENPKDGYRFSYPKNFSVLNENSGITLTSNTGQEIVVTVNAEFVEVKPNKGLKESKETKEAINIIQNTFQFTKPTIYNTKELKERFVDANNLPVN